MMRFRPTLAIAALFLGMSLSVQAQGSSVVARGDSVSVRFIDADIRSVVSMLGRYLDHPVMFGNIQASRVTLEAPKPIHRREVLGMLRGIVESQNLELALDTASGVYRVKAREVQRTNGPQPGQQQQPRGLASGSGATELFVVRLKHARATDVAALVNALYGKSSALGEPGAPPPTLAQDLRQNAVPPAGTPPAQAAQGALGRVANLQGDLTIVPDPSTNSLLVRASRTDFALVDAAIREIDIRPLQVLIEVVIAEVRKDGSYSLGVSTTVPQLSLGGALTGTASTTGAGLGDLVISLMNIGNVGAEAVLQAAASHGDVRIVSRPVVLAANNQSADITVGSQRPFIQVSRSLPTDAAQRDQVVQYKDVGTQLTVKPTISADGYVMLQITQQVNQATSEIAFDAPVISTRSVQTQLLVKNGQTVMLGGISDQQHDVSSEGIPFLSSIPWIGALFGSHSRTTSETELFLFLKPTVLFTDDDVQRQTEPLRQRAGVADPPR